MLISIAAYDLCDGTNVGGVAASDLRYRVTRAIDVVLALRSTVPFTYDRHTRTADVAFTVKRTHDTVEDAEYFAANHENDLPQSGAVKITSQDGTIVSYLTNAKLIDHHLIFQIGATTFHSYHIVGGIQDVTPPPAAGFILTESSDFILLETGDKILLE